MASPDLIVGYESALDYWRAARVAGAEPELEPEGKAFGARALTVSERARRAIDSCCTEAPLDVVGACKSEHHNSATVKDHSFSGPLTPAKLRGLGDRIFVCAPDVVFTQLAHSRSTLDLALIACEACGTYGLTPRGRDSFQGDLAPLASIAELKAYASSAKSLGFRGAARALEALDLAADGSGSPRESGIAVFLSLGRRRGGAGLKGFAMNRSLAVPSQLRAIVGSSKLKPDFLWEEQRLILEYDSNEFHLTAAQKERDEARRRVFERMGYQVKSLTSDVLQDNAKLDMFVEELEHVVSPRRRRPSPAILEARRATREILFGRESMSAVRAALRRRDEVPSS